uniref:Uncharacterized protein n=1 Tax=Plectus sambesii TaxID=2011161 RepID=A0A914VT52_9BILA
MNWLCALISLLLILLPLRTECGIYAPGPTMPNGSPEFNYILAALKVLLCVPGGKVTDKNIESFRHAAEAKNDGFIDKWSDILSEIKWKKEPLYRDIVQRLNELLFGNDCISKQMKMKFLEAAEKIRDLRTSADCVPTTGHSGVIEFWKSLVNKIKERNIEYLSDLSPAEILACNMCDSDKDKQNNNKSRWDKNFVAARDHLKIVLNAISYQPENAVNDCKRKSQTQKSVRKDQQSGAELEEEQFSISTFIVIATVAAGFGELYCYYQYTQEQKRLQEIEREKRREEKEKKEREEIARKVREEIERMEREERVRQVREEIERMEREERVRQVREENEIKEREERASKVREENKRKEREERVRQVREKKENKINMQKTFRLTAIC